MRSQVPIRRGTNKESTSEVVKIGRDRRWLPSLRRIRKQGGCGGDEEKIAEGGRSRAPEEGIAGVSEGRFLLDLDVNCLVGLQEREREFDGLRWVFFFFLATR